MRLEKAYLRYGKRAESMIRTVVFSHGERMVWR